MSMPEGGLLNAPLPPPRLWGLLVWRKRAASALACSSSASSSASRLAFKVRAFSWSSLFSENSRNIASCLVARKRIFCALSTSPDASMRSTLNGSSRSAFLAAFAAFTTAFACCLSAFACFRRPRASAFALNTSCRLSSATLSNSGGGYGASFSMPMYAESLGFSAHALARISTGELSNRAKHACKKSYASHVRSWSASASNSWANKASPSNAWASVEKAASKSRAPPPPPPPPPPSSFCVARMLACVDERGRAVPSLIADISPGDNGRPPPPPPPPMPR
mmetsp:Transcript_59771/g.117250  ORF Transcript_59771/g.117250 Transcript_59771/m.117250 type:complete len:280 (+) Transcript_59771:173-1012(+)